MIASEHVILVHGTWMRGSHWTEARQAFEQRGFTVHTPSLRHHDLPLLEGSLRVASVSLADYTDDLAELARSLDRPPLLVGLSMGGLLAQLVAARVPHAGVVAACPAPAAGVFGMYPNTVRLFGSHYLQPRPWDKPLYPTWHRLRWGAAHTQDEDYVRGLYSDLVCESGRAYCEMAFPFLDPRRAATVDFDAITGPVLAIGGERDRMISPRIPRATARRYRRGSYVEIPGADHMVLMGNRLHVTMRRIDEWLTRERVFDPAPGTGSAA
ncbi:alpha/beta hydrolase [Saccharomonospora iraqiensis]|uniref:alpha/beta hydrolase n=1 Tax=Saccharomonospora iraqiensis TaxID=52698 RepID=UPI00022DFC7E|nr:alpha/beta hydrolase [Saccharomonospora iraqiensis]